MNASRTARPTRRKFFSSSPILRAIQGMLIGMLLAGIGLLLAGIAYLAFSPNISSPGIVVAQPGPMDTATFPAPGGIPFTGITALPSETPYQPRTWTPTASTTSTPTPTATATATSTVTATVTETPTEVPSETPVPSTETPSDGLPAEAAIQGVVGYAQSLPLSCESRSAVDWARFFGANIGELDFQYSLPFTGNPNTGFVGDPRAERGQLPPDSYGVHAPPVAGLLQSYGLNAQGYFGLSFEDVRREIASGQPVIAWVVGNTWSSYGGILYTAPDGEMVTVAPYEHTVIVIAYTPDSVTVVDGSMVYSTSVTQFIQSWSVLGYQAVVME